MEIKAYQVKYVFTSRLLFLRNVCVQILTITTLLLIIGFRSYYAVLG
jgi:hypothetical protein